MKPEIILQSDTLDILFENRNKFYGAYELRKHYNVRLKKAMGFTLVIAALFIGLQFLHFKNEPVNITRDNVGAVKFTSVNITEPKPKSQTRQTPPLKQKPVATVAYKTPSIVDDDKAKSPIHTISDVLNTQIGTNDIKGENTGDKIVLPPSTGGVTGMIAAPATKKEDDYNKPLNIAEVMPQFPGGIDALIKFMQQNLRQPDDLEEGEKLVIISSFVIDIDGNIQNIKIEQHARPDLDAEVVRVLKRMPQWIAGKQNGRKVSVIYRLPVTFIAHE